MPLADTVDPNIYSTQATVSAGSTAIVADRFGFPAGTIRFINTEAVDFYVALNSTVAATTGAMRIRSCSELVMQQMPLVSRFALYTTSTGASAVKLGLTAFGG